MAKLSEEKKTDVEKLKVKVVSYTDYIQEAREQLEAGAEGSSVFNRAIELLYTRNKVIGTIERGGETRFVCEI